MPNPVVYNEPVDTAATTPKNDDPEVEAFFFDWDWIDGDPTATGGMPRRRGLDCLSHDLPMRARLNPGELVQAPQAGAGIDAQVNADDDPDSLDEVAGRYESEIRQDRRVEQAVVVPESDGQGGTQLKALVKPYAMDEFIDVSANDG